MSTGHGPSREVSSCQGPESQWPGLGGPWWLWSSQACIYVHVSVGVARALCLSVCLPTIHVSPVPTTGHLTHPFHAVESWLISPSSLLWHDQVPPPQHLFPHSPPFRLPRVPFANAVPLPCLCPSGGGEIPSLSSALGLGSAPAASGQRLISPSGQGIRPIQA